MEASQAPSEADNGVCPEMAVNEVPASELAAGDGDSERSIARRSVTYHDPIV